MRRPYVVKHTNEDLIISMTVIWDETLPPVQLALKVTTRNSTGF